MMADKGVSQAARELISDGVREVDEEIMQKLSDLHPHEDPPLLEAEPSDCL